MTRNVLQVLVAAVLLSACQAPDPLQYVDPTIGGASVLLSPTRPTTHIPNSMVRWTPGRADLLDECISDFPLSVACYRLQNLFGLLPLPSGSEGGAWEDARSVWDAEVSSPYSYSVSLEGCRVEFAPVPRGGVIRISYDNAGGGLLRLRCLCDEGSTVSFDGAAVTGTEEMWGTSAYVRMEADVPLTQVCAAGNGRAILLNCPSQVLTLRYALSYIDAGQAAANLSREIPSWKPEKVKAAARHAWEQALGRIEVSGGSDRDLRLFYTSLYRCHERMVDISEYGRYFSGFDHAVHEDPAPFYTDNWIWDTHLSLEPLWMILDPSKEEQKIRSYIEMYRQSGTLPQFAEVWGEWPAMTGNYAAVWMADALCKGLSFDVEAAYEGVRKNALESTLLPWRNGPRTVLDDFYAENGWFPALWPGQPETVPQVDVPWERRQAVSLSTTTSYCDWAAACLAHAAGRADDEALLMRRSGYWRNVYRPDKGMFWPRDEKGEWIEGVDPRYMDRAYFTENNAYTFQWDVKHDLGGLFEVMGGREEAGRRLDELFRIQLDIPKFRFYEKLPDATGMMGQFAMGNEPSFHIPYLYDCLGSPWKTQKRIHQLISLFFSDTVSGIPGDEDGGAMSAFVVFSMMGFFPLTPGVPVYAIGSPFFEKTVIHLPDGGRFVIKAKNFSGANKYIASATLDGKPLDRAWFTHAELMGGGTLELTMSPTPNPSWGTEPFRLTAGI